MTTTTPAAARPADEPEFRGDLSPVERQVAALILHSHDLNRGEHRPGDETDYLMKALVKDWAMTPRDVGAKLIAALYFARAGYDPEYPHAGHPIAILASAVADHYCNHWAELRAREKAVLDAQREREEEPEAGGGEDVDDGRPVARAFELITKLEQRLRRLEAKGEPEPAA